MDFVKYLLLLELVQMVPLNINAVERRLKYRL